MKRLPQGCALLCLFLCLGLAAAEDVEGTSCDYGWSFHNGMCYLMREEYEKFQDAENSCNLFGAQLAYGKDKNSLAFLYKLVSKNSLYGWWYGMKVSYTGKPLVLNDPNGYYTTPPLGMEPPIPKLNPLADPTTACIGLGRDPDIYNKRYLMIDVPCDVKLPYICRGDISLKVSDPTKLHVVKNGTRDILWFSSRSDRRSYKDAEKACKDKSMTLTSIRGSVQMNVIKDQLKLLMDDHVDPWWIGMKVENGVYSWSNKVYMDNSIVNWNRKNRQFTRYPRDCRILLTTETASDANCYQAKAPFICMKEHRLTGQFGCHHNWVRAGKSCYKKATLGQSLTTYTNAERLCAKVDSHPISIKSNVDKVWLLQSSFYDVYNTMFWTSLSDRKKNGTFFWADGTAPKPSILTWSLGNKLQGSGQCFYFEPRTKSLYRSGCRYEQLPGCQYPSTGSCVSNKWKYFKGQCYYDLSKNPDNWESRESFPTQLNKCYNDLVQYSSTILISKLKIDSVEIMDFYKNMIGNAYAGVWTGMKDDGYGVYKWDDGTAADTSIFKTDNYFGEDLSTSKCAIMNQNGKFTPKSCSTYEYGQVICQKGVTDTGDGNIVMSHFLLIWMMFLICRLV